VPLCEIGGSFRLASGGNEKPVVALVPVDRRLVHVVPGEFVEHEQRGQAGELVERGLERVDMVEDAAGDDRVERAGVVELLERELPVQRPDRRGWIDCEDVVTRRGECRSDPALAAAADLEDALRRRREL